MILRQFLTSREFFMIVRKNVSRFLTNGLGIILRLFSKHNQCCLFVRKKIRSRKLSEGPTDSNSKTICDNQFLLPDRKILSLER